MVSSLPHLSDTDDDSAVDAVIAEAADVCALEQIAALNTAHLSDSSLLPSHLESRFRKLKSLPNPTTPPPPHPPEKENSPDALKLSRARTLPNPPLDPEKPEEPIPDRDRRKAEIFTLGNVEPPKKAEPKSKSRFGSSPSFSVESSGESSPSPPRQRRCFGCYPKRAAQRRKGKGDDVLSELGIPSLKEEQRKLKKALKDQEKAMREAKKMVKWVKQASARMNAAAIDELLSDDEEIK